jgi:myo-inositol-1(or 4)-monophosphatase
MRSSCLRAVLDVEDKGERGYDPVTVADHAAEAVIRAEIARAYPDHGIRGEEHGTQVGASKYTWVIDPIDGTRSFILGQMHWATLIALNDGDGVVVGVAHQPYVGESFVATAGGGGEWRRGKEQRALRTRRCRNPQMPSSRAPTPGCSGRPKSALRSTALATRRG